MTKLLSLSPKPRAYSSFERFESHILHGVWVTIRRMSLGRRIELAQAVRDLVARLEFLGAGAALSDRIEAALVESQIDAVYLRWGLVSVEGIELDGCIPAAESIIDRAPEDFVREVVGRIKAQCGLTEEEVKN